MASALTKYMMQKGLTDTSGGKTPPAPKPDDDDDEDSIEASKAAAMV